MNKPRTRSKGFSIIEITCVFVLVGILAATAYSTISTESHSVVTENDRLKATLRFAQMYAMKDIENWQVVITSSSYTLRRVGLVNNSLTTINVAIPGTDSSTHDFIGSSVSSGAATILFDNRGRPYLNGNTAANMLANDHTITLSGYQNEATASLVITAVTGYIQ